MPSLSLLAAERSCSAQTLMNETFRVQNKDTIDQFLRANNFTSPTDRIGRGQMFAAPLGDSWHPALEAQLAKDLARSNFAIRHQPQAPAAEEFNANFSWLESLLSDGTAGKIASETADGTREYFERRTAEIAKMFRNYENSYRDSLKLGGDFSKGAAASARTFIKRDLDSQLTGVSRKAFLPNPHHSNLKKALNLSHKAARNVRKVGAAEKEIAKIVQAGDKATRAAGYLKKAGWVGKVISIGSASLDVKETYQQQGSQAARMHAGKELSKFGGSYGGSIAGAKLGGMAGAGLAVAFGVGTGGLGFVALAVGGAVVGSVGGGMTGEFIAENAWEKFGDDIYAFGEDMLSIFEKRRID